MGLGLVAHCAEVPGANGQGKTQEECLANLREAIAVILEHRREGLLRHLCRYGCVLRGEGKNILFNFGKIDKLVTLKQCPALRNRQPAGQEDLSRLSIPDPPANVILGRFPSS